MHLHWLSSSQSKSIKIIWYRFKHFFYKSGFHESVFPFCQHSQTQSSPPLQDIFPAIDIDLPTPVQHSLDPPSSPTSHNAPEPPANQPSSPTRHNAPEPLADQLSSPMPGSPTPITEPSPANLPVRRSSCTSTPPSWLQDYIRNPKPIIRPLTKTGRMEPSILCIIFFLIHDFLLHIVHILLTSQPAKNHAQAILDPNWQKAIDEQLSAL